MKDCLGKDIRINDRVAWVYSTTKHTLVVGSVIDVYPTFIDVWVEHPGSYSWVEGPEEGDVRRVTASHKVVVING